MGNRGPLILREMAGRGRARVRVFPRAKRVRPLPALVLDFEQRPDFPHDALTPLQGALGAERAPGFQHLLLDLLDLRGRPLDEARELVVRTTTSSHRGEIDREPADVAPVGIAHDQRDPRRPREVPRGEAVDAAGEAPPVLLPCRGPLVLDEGRLDLALGHEQSGRVEAREVLARALEPRPEQEAILLLAQELVRRVGLQGLVPEGRVARRQDEPVERREHGDALTRSVRHTPLRVERLDGHRARADAERILALAGRERERRCARRRSQEQRAEERGDGESGATHGIRPTTTRLNDSAAKNRWAARWTSRAVTRETPAL